MRIENIAICVKQYFFPYVSYTFLLSKVSRPRVFLRLCLVQYVPACIWSATEPVSSDSIENTTPSFLTFRIYSLFRSQNKRRMRTTKRCLTRKDADLWRTHTICMALHNHRVSYQECIGSGGTKSIVGTPPDISTSCLPSANHMMHFRCY